jgi:hypothetical protein
MDAWPGWGTPDPPAYPPPSFAISIPRVYVLQRAHTLTEEAHTMSDVDRDDRIERALLDGRRKRLEERFGAVFSPPDDSLPPEIERAWLDSIERFEEAMDRSRTTTVREYIGNPPLRPLGEIPPGELGEAVDWLMELLAANDIVVQIGENVSLAETYRFLSEELMEAETDDIRVEGFSTLFLYDDFHPDERAEAERTAREFCLAMFERSEADLVRLIGGAHDGDPPQMRRAGSLLRDAALEFFAHIGHVSQHTVQIEACDIGGDRATVTGSATWNGELPSGRTQVGASGAVKLTLSRCPFGGWDVIEARLPGMGIVAAES